MNDEQLKAYWYPAYTDALKLLKNYRQVTEQHIAQTIKKYGNGVFNRLFCLVVWQEIKRIRAGEPSLKYELYSNAIADTWRLFKAYSDPNDSEQYWDDLVSGIHGIFAKYGHGRFIVDLLVHVTLEEIERIWREQKVILSEQY